MTLDPDELHSSEFCNVLIDLHLRFNAMDSIRNFHVSIFRQDLHDASLFFSHCSSGDTSQCFVI